MVAVTVSAADGVRGLMLQGRRVSNNAAVGRFVVDSTTTTTFDCEVPDDTLVAWYGGDAGFSSKSFTWMPPDDDVGPLQFVYVRRSVVALPFLADRTNGRAYATVLRLSSSSVVCLSSARNALWLNGAS